MFSPEMAALSSWRIKDAKTTASSCFSESATVNGIGILFDCGQQKRNETKLIKPKQKEKTTKYIQCGDANERLTRYRKRKASAEKQYVQSLLSNERDKRGETTVMTKLAKIFAIFGCFFANAFQFF
jgi:hypothetical protein